MLVEVPDGHWAQSQDLAHELCFACRFIRHRARINASLRFEACIHKFTEFLRVADYMVSFEEGQRCHHGD